MLNLNFIVYNVKMTDKLEFALSFSEKHVLTPDAFSTYIMSQFFIFLCVQLSK